VTGSVKNRKNAPKIIVGLPGFQKGRDIKALYKEKRLKMRKTDRISLLSGSIKCFLGAGPPGK
jgi:hypothetical protein